MLRNFIAYYDCATAAVENGETTWAKAKEASQDQWYALSRMSESDVSAIEASPSRSIGLGDWVRADSDTFVHYCRVRGPRRRRAEDHRGLREAARGDPGKVPQFVRLDAFHRMRSLQMPSPHSWAGLHEPLSRTVHPRAFFARVVLSVAVLFRRVEMQL